MKERVHLSPAVQYARANTLLDSIDPKVISSIDYEIATHLKKFQDDYILQAKDGSPHDLTKMKTEKLKTLIENMVKADGKFKYAGIVPFEKLCTDCNGFGFKMKFFRKKVQTVECKDCDKDPRTGKANGNQSVLCTVCKGTGESKDSVYPCEQCNGTGISISTCNTCRGEGEFHIAPIDSKIKSTTHCKTCNGRGFLTDEPVATPPKLKMDWSKKRSVEEPLKQNFGDILKAAIVQKD